MVRYLYTCWVRGILGYADSMGVVVKKFNPEEDFPIVIALVAWFLIGVLVGWLI